MARFTCGRKAGPPGPWLALCLASVTFGSASGALVLNEILYDPPGSDAGAEWLEVHNTGPWPATLEGVTIERADGGTPGSWKQTWAGRAGEWVEAGGYFWIGGAYRGRPSDSAAEPDLQNGPDGVRLLRGGLELDRVGWGVGATWPCWEGEPAAEAGDGQSLARRDDGVDSDDNAADFQSSPATPGRPNHPDVDASVRLLRQGRHLPLAGGSGEIAAVARVTNCGGLPLDPARLRLTAGRRLLLPDPPRAGDLLPAGESLELEVLLEVRASSGLQSWASTVSVQGDPVPENDADTLALWVGPPPLWIERIAPRPDTSSTEWIALRCGLDAVELQGWSVADHGGNVLSLLGHQAGPGEQVAVAREADRVPVGLNTVGWSGSWTTLNDSAPVGAAADSLFLIEPGGVIVDWATYGRSELGSIWTRPEGPAPWRFEDQAKDSFGSLEAPLAPREGRIGPAAWSPRRAPGGIAFRLPGAALPGTWALRLYDLNGTLIWSDVGESRDRRDCSTTWRGRRNDGGWARPGVYVVEVAASPDGKRPWRARETLVVGR